jgi:hypothetical protein
MAFLRLLTLEIESSHMAKEKPLLHQVKGAADPELFNPDLDWYFNCLDSECGLKGIEHVSDESVAVGYHRTAEHASDGELIRVKRSVPVKQDSMPYDDRHATFKSNTDRDHSGCSFTKGRRIWRRLGALSWDRQQLMRRYYEPRREKAVIPESDIRNAHRAYLGLPELGAAA